MSVDRRRFLNAAESIGLRLCRDAVWTDGRCSWLGWVMVPHAGRATTGIGAMGTDFYAGTAGIGLFLAYLASLMHDPIVRATAEAALAQALTAVDSLAASGEYGFYCGLSGIGWACRAAGLLLVEEALISRGEAVLRLAASMPPDRRRIDLMSGSAGLILALLDIAMGGQCEKLLMAAVQHGQHLLDTAERDEQGWSWNTLGVANTPHLLGLAHGASGIACALAALGHTTNRSEFLNGVGEALRYERNHFRPVEGNWPDLRSFAQPLQGGEPPCMVAWCHGAAGIGIARLYVNRLLPKEPAVLSEAEIAIHTTAATLERAFYQAGDNFSLCHGSGGNADLLILASDLLDRPALRQKAEMAGICALEQFEESRTPWPCGIAGAGETPNLLLGLAGIGYFFLRLYDPNAVPTVLLPFSELARVSALVA